MKMTRSTAAIVSLLAATVATGLPTATASAAQPAPKPVVKLTGSSHTTPRPISVDEYVNSGGSPSTKPAAGAAAPKCWSAQFNDSLSVTNWPFPGEFEFAAFGYTGKWCDNNGTLWRMAVMNAYVQNVGPGTVIFSKKSHSTVGRTVWNNKYAIGVEKFNLAGTVEAASVKHTFSVERCIRSWGDRYGNRWQSKSCSVL
ncbi:hypothetical protein GCM10018780_88480 [Streptomyces lanatus]|nr:hypothetical protein GCM10018780_88480 [Streptomyces lanatus]